jgi:hypothetical protein
MPDLIRGSEGHQFTIGRTRIYAGPGLKGHRYPILAIKRPSDKKDRIVAEFKNSSSVEAFIAALAEAIDEATAIPIRAEDPPLSSDRQAALERFGFDTPPEPAELIERIQLLGQGKVTFVTEEEVA